MFHPLMPSLKDKSLDDIITESNALSAKFNQAMRFGNAQLAQQIKVVLNHYQLEYQSRMNDVSKKAENDKMFKNKVKVNK